MLYKANLSEKRITASMFVVRSFLTRKITDDIPVYSDCDPGKSNGIKRMPNTLQFLIPHRHSLTD